MGRRKTVGGAEYDLGDRRWRRLLCYLNQHSGAAKVKRGLRRRERRQVNQQLTVERKEQVNE